MEMLSKQERDLLRQRLRAVRRCAQEACITLHMNWLENLRAMPREQRHGYGAWKAPAGDTRGNGAAAV